MHVRMCVMFPYAYMSMYREHTVIYIHTHTHTHIHACTLGMCVDVCALVF